MNIVESAKIDGIKLYKVKLPLKDPYQISGGVLKNRISLIVELKSEGFTGYGESAPFIAPFYSSETISTAEAILKENIFAKVIDKEVLSIDDFNNLISRNIRGNNFAKAGIETAYWDLIARKNKIPLHDLIYYKLKQMDVSQDYLERREYIESGAAIGIQKDFDLKIFKREINEFLEKGYQRIKIKIKPGWDVKPVEIVRNLTGDDFPFWVDANSAYNYNEDVEIFKELDYYNCLFYEQPLHHDDLLDHAKLEREIKTPVCLDESLKDSRSAYKALELNSSKIWNIKIQRVGGLLEACKIYKIAVENDVKLWGGTMPESGLGAQAIIALACFKAFVFPSDIEPSIRWFDRDIDLLEMEMNSNGKIFLNNNPGIGDIDLEKIKEKGKLIYKL